MVLMKWFYVVMHAMLGYIRLFRKSAYLVGNLGCLSPELLPRGPLMQTSRIKLRQKLQSPCNCESHVTWRNMVERVPTKRNVFAPIIK